MNLYPLKLTAVAKSAIWGGQRLRRDWSKQSDLPVIAETWELTVREKENNVIENGAFHGEKLADVLKNWGKSALGTRAEGKRFPLLVKFIDAADRLSVQVHPDDEFAAAAEHDLGKTEMWYIVEADEGAEILMGLVPGATAKDFAKATAAGDPEPVLRHVKVQKGDCFFIPAGMPHAIGKGILVAEIQQNCDLTYRVFDYNRRDKDGHLRELHIEKALQVTRPFTQAEVDAIRYARGRGDADLLAACPYFTVRRAVIDGEHTDTATNESFVSLLFLSGDGFVEADGCRVPFAKGESIFLPAGMGDYHIVGKGEVLISTL
ncbi:MAG: class I mannose-6-phosphate isomerase [Clostridia bacterium]|nr:class I mannose-6-phosphate isomerase [Clostridia bacterium]